MTLATRKFYKGSEAIDAIMNGKPLTKKQKEAKERREQKDPIPIDSTLSFNLLNIGYFRMKQTHVYICTIIEFISSRCCHIAVHLENEILNGIYTSLYTIT